MEASQNPLAKRKAGAATETDHYSKQRQKKIKEADEEAQGGNFLDHLAEDEGVKTERDWSRPQPPADVGDLVFQQYDIDYTIMPQPLAGMPGCQSGPVPVIRMYGFTRDGYSVVAKIHGVLPYFFIPAPEGFKEADCEKIRLFLHRHLESLISSQGKVPNYCLAVEPVEKMSILGYQTQMRTFLKITLASPKHVPQARQLLENGVKLVNEPGYTHKGYITYESNVPFVLRFMIDRGIVGGNWIEIKRNDYKRTANVISRAQIEIDVAYDKLVSHPTINDYAVLGPIRMLSFDIECVGRKGFFPEPEHDPVIQIANIVSIQGQSKPLIRNVFVVGGCATIVGADVRTFRTEQEMLLAWSQFVVATDPDFLTGYNIVNFDLPYLLNRAAKLKLELFPYMGRIRDSKTKVKDTTFSSKAYGTREGREVSMDGRVIFDVLQAIQRDYKLRSYSLNSVSAEFLGQQKEDVHHSIIADLFRGSDDDRKRLAVYCLKDAYLPLRLLDKLMCIVNYTEMARVTGVPINYLLTRGQQIKVVSQLYRQCIKEDLLIPTLKQQQSAAGAGEEEAVGYKGATVLDPKRGYYQQPITTLDFASLYPSIMISHNLCYTTLLPKGTKTNLSQEDYETTPNGECFVRASKKRGLLPRILESLLAARANAKNELKKETDPQKKAVLDGRQNALKISANSVYGFTGATKGQLACIEISSSVTAFGRDMIETTKQLVEAKYTIANGYKFDAEVIYGDTDSVMVKFGESEMARNMELGKEAAAFITTHFPRPISLAFEKVYFPFLLIERKRYAGLLWTNPRAHDKMDCKGIESVRRDNCPLVKNVVNTSLHKILIERDVDGAVAYAKGVISDLLCNKLDLSMLVISKALSKKAEDYKQSNQAHLILAEKMRKRDAGTAPSTGDRVPYVIVKSHKDAKAYEKAEDPLWALEKNIPLDTNYYLENQLSHPIHSIFDPIVKDANIILHGDHTRTIQIVTPTSSAGGISSFAKRRPTCMGCRTALEEGQHTVCSHCKSREGEIYQRQLVSVQKLEKQFAAAWTQCQRCQGSLLQPVLCTSRDCPIFYRRKKIQKDLADTQEALERWNLNW